MRISCIYAMQFDQIHPQLLLPNPPGSLLSPFPPNFVSCSFFLQSTESNQHCLPAYGCGPSIGAWIIYPWSHLKKTESLFSSSYELPIAFQLAVKTWKSPLLVLASRMACSCEGLMQTATATINSREQWSCYVQKTWFQSSTSQLLPNCWCNCSTLSFKPAS